MDIAAFGRLIRFNGSPLESFELRAQPCSLLLRLLAKPLFFITTLLRPTVAARSAGERASHSSTLGAIGNPAGLVRNATMQATA